MGSARKALRIDLKTLGSTLLKGAVGAPTPGAQGRARSEALSGP